MKCWIVVVGLVFSFTVLAEPQTSKDWTWDPALVDDDFFYAATVNSEDRIFGQYCYVSTENCIYIVDMGITCEPKSKMPAILNSDGGVVAVDMVCGDTINNGGNALVITPFDSIDDIVKSDKKVGIVIAMEDQSFKVVRFSLSGSGYAIEKMRNAAMLVINKNGASRGNIADEEYL